MICLQRTARHFALLFVLSYCLTACIHTDFTNSDAETPTQQQLQPSDHPLDQMRFLQQVSATPICPHGLDDYACENYAANSLSLKYPQLIFNVQSQPQNSLVLRLYDGHMKVYLPKIDPVSKQCEVCHYQVIMEYPNIHSVLIAKSMPDQRRYVLLNLQSGAEIELSHYPIFNKDFQLFAVLNSALEVEAGENDIKLYQFDENQKFQLIFDGLTAHAPMLEAEISPNAVAQPRIVEVNQQTLETKAPIPMWNKAWGASQGVWIDTMQLVFTSLQDDDADARLHYYRLHKVVTATDHYWSIDAITEKTYLEAIHTTASK